MAEGKRGLHVALEILSRRDRSEADLRRRLLAKGIPGEEIDWIVGRLKELGYLDDRRLAERLATKAVTDGTGYGIRLALDLARQGVPRDIADATLARLSADYDERALVRDLLARKFPAYDAATADNRQTARVMNYLLRRGFSRAAVYDALKHQNPDSAGM